MLRRTRCESASTYLPGHRSMGYLSSDILLLTLPIPNHVRSGWLQPGMRLQERETDRTHHDTNRRRNMSKKILLLGFSDSVLADALQQLARPGLEVFRGKSVEDVRSRLSQTTIDHVFIGESSRWKPTWRSRGKSFRQATRRPCICRIDWDQKVFCRLSRQSFEGLSRTRGNRCFCQ
jgi:hypothetical protein